MAFQLEEEIQQLTQQNIELQDPASMTDKEKAKLKKAEEKRLKKERKEREKEEG